MTCPLVADGRHEHPGDDRDVHPENPDDLLLLQLACRARELA